MLDLALFVDFLYGSANDYVIMRRSQKRTVQKVSYV